MANWHSCLVFKYQGRPRPTMHHYSTLVRSNSRTNGSQSFGSASEGQSHQQQDERSDACRYKYKGTDGHNPMTGHNGTLSKGQPSNSCSDLSSSGYGLDLTTMKKELEILRSDLLRAKKTIITLRDNEKQLKDRLSGQALKIAAEMSSSEHLDGLGDKRPTALIRRYGSLYTGARTNTLDALDKIPELNNADELKTKLLFTVIVLAFRSVSKRICDIKEAIAQILQMPDPQEDFYSAELQVATSNYLRRTTDRYDVKKIVEEVCNQIWATLYDYPCLKTCEGLLRYIHDCVKVAWGLCNQTPSFSIEYETRFFRREIHVRFHSSNHDSDYVKSYVWPALFDDDAATIKSSASPPPPSASTSAGASKPNRISSCVCVYKGVVIT